MITKDSSTVYPVFVVHQSIDLFSHSTNEMKRGGIEITHVLILWWQSVITDGRSFNSPRLLTEIDSLLCFYGNDFDLWKNWLDIGNIIHKTKTRSTKFIASSCMVGASMFWNLIKQPASNYSHDVVWQK